MKRKLTRLFELFLIVLILPIMTFPLLATNSGIDTTNLETEEAGTYPVTFSYTDKDSGEVKQKTVYITVVKPRTVKNELFAEAIDANDIIIKKGELVDITKEQLIIIAGAHAWSLIDGSKIPIISAELKMIDEKSGIYEVIFSTARGTQTTIKILEMEEKILLAEEEYINDITIFNKIFEWGRILVALILLMLILLGILYIYIQRKVKIANEILYKYNGEHQRN